MLISWLFDLGGVTKENMSKRVYIMDCGKFVKIGVSKNVDKRTSQIPYIVKQYYCTERLENAYEVEKNMHKFFKPVRNKEANGLEYFSISFDIATEALNEILVADKKILNAFLEGISCIDDCEKDAELYYKILIKSLRLLPGDLYVVAQTVDAMLRKDEINNKYYQNQIA